MCGIIHCKRTDKKFANNLVRKRYFKQKSRGSTGFGFIEMQDGFVKAEVRTQTEAEILKHLESSTADEILFHHRHPTSTPNFIEATHPIKVSNKNLKYNYYVVHNGIIWNDKTLHNKHIEDGYEYTTEIQKKWIASVNVYEASIWNDSEAVAIDFAELIEKKKPMQARGSIAIVALQYSKKTGKAIALYYGHNSGNPLRIEDNRDFMALSSESGKSLPADMLYRYSYKTDSTSCRAVDIGYHEPAKQIGFITTLSGKVETDWDAPWEEKLAREEEEDFDMEEWEEEVALEDRIQRAYNDGDYDKAMSLEDELEVLHRKQSLSRTKKIWNG